MKVLQVVPSIGAESSGPSYSVPGLCRGLLSVGCDVELHFGGTMPKRQFGYPVCCYPFSMFPHPRLGRSPSMLIGLKRSIATADIIHNNSFWMFPNVYPYLVSKCSSSSVAKLVNAPRGTLAEWSLKHHWLQKRIFGSLCRQYAAMSGTDMWHATCEKEYEEIRALGYRQPVAIVPIGMDIPEGLNELHGRQSDDRMHRIVFFGRLHKVKAIENLLLAWSALCENGFAKDWEVVIAGPDGGVRASLEALVSEKRLPRVRFVGEINGFAKYEFLSSSDIYVLPSLTENFAVTVAEALACGVPVIASQGTPWKGLDAERAGRWVLIGATPLANGLRELMLMSDDERKQMGICGQKWIGRDFTWNGIGRKMKMAYEWVIGKCDKPEWVKED